MKRNFREYIFKVTELNSSVFVLIKRYRGKILGDRQKILYKDLKNITENIYEEYALKSKDLTDNFSLISN